MPTILCADDEPQILQIFKRILMMRGHVVHTCATGEQVLNLVEREEMDVIILDLILGEMSGFDVLEQLRANPRTNRVPILVVSGMAHEDEIVKAMSLGADDFLIKPVRQDELLAKIAVAMSRRHSKTSHGISAGLQPGSLFADRYRIIRPINSGGFGTIYGAIDITNQITVDLAIKVFKIPEKHDEESFLPQLLREANSLVNLDHPNVIRMYDFGQSGRYYFLVMEFAQGQPLDVIVEKRGPLPERAVALIGYEVASALHYLEEQRIVHRDIKPDNIMITEDSELKLIDFGLAKMVGDKTLSGRRDEFQGTAQFVSPEYIDGDQELDIRADIYSLGVTLYFAATAISPFKAETTMQTLMNHMEVIPPSVDTINPEIREELSMLIDSMMAKHRDDRPDMRNLLEFLGDILTL